MSPLEVGGAPCRAAKYLPLLNWPIAGENGLSRTLI